MNETQKSGRKSRAYTVKGKVLETGPVKGGKTGPYVRSVLQTAKGKLTVMTFGAIVEKLADVIVTGSEVTLGGGYRRGTEGGVTFVAGFVPAARTAAA